VGVNSYICLRSLLSEIFRILKILALIMVMIITFLVVSGYWCGLFHTLLRAAIPG